jgi:hypothetical protein
MPITKTGYWKYKSYNVFDVESLSSYALEQTPLKFIPTEFASDDYSDIYLIWDFGDGSTQQKGFSASHYYFYPGQYNVTMYVMLSSGDSAIDSFNSTVTIKDFVPNSFAFESLSAPNSTMLYLSAGIYSPTLTLNRYNSLQSYGNVYSFFLNVSGSNSLFYDINKLSKEPYAHLLPTHRFVTRELVGDNLSDTIIDKIDTVDSNLYGKLDEDSLVVPTSSSDVNAFFVGTSGYANFNFVDDFYKNENYYIFATLDTSNFPDNYTKYYNLPVNSEFPIKNSSSSYYKIAENASIYPDSFSITSNGIDGEGFVLDTFKIGPVKYVNQPISFVGKLKNNNFDIKNQDWFLNKGFLDFATNTYSLSVVTATGGNALNGSAEDYITLDLNTFKDYRNGWFKGFITLPISAFKDYNVDTPFFQLYASLDTGTTTITGSSNFFQVNLLSTNKVAKINENFDTATYMKDLAYQPSIYKRPQIFDTFFGTALGSLSSTTNSIGKRVYEKTSNFISNNVNIDTCNIQNLYSFALEYNVDLDDFATSNLLINYPADLARLVNLFSIKKSFLFGKRVQDTFNFNDKYRQGTNFNDLNLATYNYQLGKIGGNNTGNPIDILSGTINKKDNYIVAYEHFSEDYTLLRTNVINDENLNVKSQTVSSYPLSTFNSNWGWPLVLPNNFFNNTNYIYELSSYYTFYNFINVVPGEWNNNIINWDDQYQTTVDLLGNDKLSSTYLPSYLSSYEGTPLYHSHWDSVSGVVAQNINYQLSVGLELLSAN